MAITITRTNWVDDDGSGTYGTVINNAEKTSLYDQIDAALALLLPLAGGTISGDLTVGGSGFQTAPTLTSSSYYAAGLCLTNRRADQSDIRNWAIQTDHTAYGDFNILQSATLGGTPTERRAWITPSGTFGVAGPVLFESTLGVTGAATFSSTVAGAAFIVGNGQFFMAYRASGGLLINLLGIESGTDRTLMTITDDYVIQNGSNTPLLTMTSTGALTLVGGLVSYGVNDSGGPGKRAMLVPNA